MYLFIVWLVSVFVLGWMSCEYFHENKKKNKKLEIPEFMLRRK